MPLALCSNGKHENPYNPIYPSPSRWAGGGAFFILMAEENRRRLRIIPFHRFRHLRAFGICACHGGSGSLGKALRCWQYIKENLIDTEHGEWYWSRYADGTLNTVDDKAGFWKCPYHNGRMCLEILERI